MCLAVPGKVLEIDKETPEFRSATVDFAGVRRAVNLAFTPDVMPGEYVIVHAGFALQVLNEDEAQRTLAMLRELEEPGGELP
jgi:hydrogenase expression/formation protein HypC